MQLLSLHTSGSCVSNGVRVESLFSNLYRKYSIVGFGSTLVVTSAKDVYGSVCLSVCLSVGLCKNYLYDFHETWWTGVARAEEEPIQVWSGSDSRGGSTNYF